MDSKYKSPFSLLTRGITFSKPKPQNKDNTNIISTDNVFPDLTKEKENINTIKKQIKLIAKSNKSQEDKDKAINKLKISLNQLKKDLFTKLNLTSTSIDDIDPLVSFKEIETKLKLKNGFTNDIIYNKYHYKYPSPIQSVLIPLLFNYHNIIASSATGTGKTMAYIIPIVHNIFINKQNNNHIKAIIVLPTKELSKQIYAEFMAFNIYYCELKNLTIKYINKGLILSIQNDSKQFINNTDIIIATPNNISNILNICGNDLIDKLSYFILDEADKFFDFGFEDTIMNILVLLKNKKISKCFLSATIFDFFSQVLITPLLDSIRVSIGLSNIPCRDIQQEFIYCTNEDGKLIGIKNLLQGGIEYPALIFVEGIKKLMSVYNKIKYEVQKISYIHSKMSKKEREEQIDLFRTGQTWVLLCSDLLARGVDFKCIKTVINYDCPYRIVNYIHRVGRTGRAGRKGKAYTFVIDDDVDKLKPISKMVNLMDKENPGCIKCPKWLKNLNNI